MDILVIGGGGREHAIIKKLKQSPLCGKIYALPGNGGIAEDAVCVPIAATDIAGIKAFASENHVDFAAVIPDDPLAMGLTDELRAMGIPCFGPSKAAAIIESSKAFSKELMKKYGIDSDHVIRHFDVNGKHCPAYFMDKDAWAGFKKRLNSVESKPADKEEVSTTFKPYEVRITISNLNIRKGPGTNYDKIGKFVNPGVYTIVEESNGKGSDKGWGRLKSGIGWISLDFVTKN